MRRKATTFAQPKTSVQRRVSSKQPAFRDIDGRTAAGRRRNEILKHLLAELGNEPTELQRIMVQRAAHLMASCESFEAAMVEGDEKATRLYFTGLNLLTKILGNLGVALSDRRSAT